MFFCKILALIRKISKVKKIQNFHIFDYFLQSCIWKPEKIFEKIDQINFENPSEKENRIKWQFIYKDLKRKLKWRLIWIAFWQIVYNIVYSFFWPIFHDLLTKAYHKFEKHPNDEKLENKTIVFFTLSSFYFMIIGIFF